MSMATLEKAILDGLHSVSGNPKITKNWIMEWSTGEIKVDEGETLYRLPELGINCAVKEPAKKPRTK